MERVGVLIDKLQEQLLQKSDVRNMLVTAQLLHSELLIQANKVNGSQEKKVSVFVPNAIVINPEVAGEAAPTQEQIVVTQSIAELQVGTVPGHESYKPVPKPEPEPAPVVEPAPDPESPLPDLGPLPTPKPEPEPIPHFVEQKPWQHIFGNKEEKQPAWSLDPVMEVPTLAHQQKVVYELNDTMVGEGALASINDRLKQNNTEVSSLLQEAPIRDLKKAISINDRHRFIHELFRDDENMYERSIKTINSFHIFAEAEYWIQRELKVKLGWDTSLELVKTFDHLVRRRFS